MDILSRVPAFRSVRAQKLAADFAAFAKEAWGHYEPTRKLVWSPAYDLLCAVLVAAALGDERYRRVIWNQAPRTAKSFLCSVAFPCWLWINHPDLAIVCCSYSMDLAIKLNLARRSLIQSHWFRQLWGDRNPRR